MTRKIVIRTKAEETTTKQNTISDNSVPLSHPYGASLKPLYVGQAPGARPPSHYCSM